MKWALAALTCSLAFAASPTVEIKIDQVGYLPSAPKVAMLAAAGPAREFTVRRAAGGSVVLRGNLGEPNLDPDSGDRVQAIDFTRLTAAGKYYIDVPGVGRSWDFEIGDNVFSRAFYLAMRSYYGQRCGIAVDLGPGFPRYKHAACHLEGAFHASSGKNGTATSAAGWHDAGDYGRYVVNSGLSTGTLLWTWELFGNRIQKVNLSIPESGNGTPDILNEIRWNLNWMLSMQGEDGGVWHKQTTERFPGFVMPEKDTMLNYIVGTGQEPYKSSCATGDFAAVMAIAARVYKPFDEKFSQRSRLAAQKAWTWLEKYPNVLFRNPSGVSTGEYGDSSCSDELLWASAELWRTTGDDVYNRYFLAHFEDQRKTIRPTGPPTWGSVGAMGLWTYVLGPKPDAAADAAIRRDSLAAADEIVKRTAANAYRISMTTRDYVWGSNSVAANYGVQLLVANQMQRDPRYVNTALENLHYLLGKNTFSLSWVTQLGSNPFKHPHHRPSGADENPDPWPGLLSGGPNRGRNDPLMQKALPATTPPARMYLDDQESYASNEVAINWNAPLVFLLAAALPEK